MKKYEFSLRFDVSYYEDDLDFIDDQIYEAGCDDVLIRHGRKAEVLIEFARDGLSAIQVLTEAKSQVLSALPKARLLEAKPDFVGPTDIADFYGISRQRVQVIVQSKLANVHAFTIVGNTQIYRLATVIDELAKHVKQDLDDSVREAAFAAMQLNLEAERAVSL